MSNVRYGLGDNPTDVSDLWLDSCSDGHPEVIFIGGLAGSFPMTAGGNCPVCAAIAAAHPEHTEGEEKET